MNLFECESFLKGYVCGLNAVAKYIPYGDHGSCISVMKGVENIFLNASADNFNKLIGEIEIPRTWAYEYLRECTFDEGLMSAMNANGFFDFKTLPTVRAVDCEANVMARVTHSGGTGYCMTDENGDVLAEVSIALSEDDFEDFAWIFYADLCKGDCPSIIEMVAKDFLLTHELTSTEIRLVMPQGEGEEEASIRKILGNGDTVAIEKDDETGLYIGKTTISL